ncbi:arginine N-succinyltransferase [Neiella marina]|uniref:Arginine N-succinyltransferase n=1 Tax=Neiella holothuriorum TaxID=2870530 RepID=A0ABS7ECE2_9GAMM|nr:arginine N-succinyltransferase [Neiella holothuriorum]MBW8189994.1 arginine N-succinyltransferase [Neiella holothuriorum]
MLIIRPIAKQDFQALQEIAEQSGIGFTSLPQNDELLKAKIARSVNSFACQTDKPGDQGYLFVAEDTETGEVVGTAGIEASVGLTDAFYHYRLGSVVHSSPELGIHKTVKTLSLCNDYTGAAELCTLFLKKSHRRGSNGRLLAKSRFLFMASHPLRFGDTVIAEMRGVSDEQGRSPFWQWLQEHFFDLDFPTADYLTGIGEKRFIAELMPKYPIYVNLLSKAAQDVIGQVHPSTEPAIALLKKEGFRYKNYVDIFDAGPTVECPVDHVETVRYSQAVVIRIGELATPATEFLLANTCLTNYRAGVVTAHQQEGELFIDAKQAAMLGLSDGDGARCFAMSSDSNSTSS